MSADKMDATELTEIRERQKPSLDVIRFGDPLRKPCLLDLPGDCLKLVMEQLVEYDESCNTNLKDAVRLLRVSSMSTRSHS